MIRPLPSPSPSPLAQPQMLHPPKVLKVKIKGHANETSRVVAIFVEFNDQSSQKAFQDGVLSGDEGGGSVHG